MSDSTPSRRLFSPLFMTSVVVLAVSVVGLRPAIGKLIDRFSKEPIELRQTLTEADGEFFSAFIRDPRVEGLSIRPEDLGTEEYIWWGLRERDDHLNTGSLFVTYYSDPRDQVPHTPEVCWRQAGAVINTLTTTPVELTGIPDGPRTVDAKLLDITLGGQFVTVYVICCNGRFYNDREQVRFAIGWPGDRFVYFAKIEATAAYETDAERDIVIERCKRILQESIPYLLDSHFPAESDLR